MSELTKIIRGAALVGTVSAVAYLAIKGDNEREKETTPFLEAATNRNMQLIEFNENGEVLSVDTITPYTINIPGCERIYFRHLVSSGAVNLPSGYDCYSEGKLKTRLRYIGPLEVAPAETSNSKPGYGHTGNREN